MPMPSLTSHRPLAFGAALGLSLLTLLSGCASKNPLIDGPEPAPQAAVAPARTEPQAEAATVPSAAAKTADAAPSAADKTAAASDKPSGPQTTKPTGFRRFLGIFSPHRVDIPQGNFVSQEMVSQLREGLTEDQVRFLLGTPLLTDPFHADRWDYPFRILKSNGEVTTSRISIYFKDKRVVRVDGAGSLPTEADYLARIAGKAGKTVETSPGPNK